VFGSERTLTEITCQHIAYLLISVQQLEH